jgi:acetylornithine deacetylase
MRLGAGGFVVPDRCEAGSTCIFPEADRAPSPGRSAGGPPAPAYVADLNLEVAFIRRRGYNQEPTTPWLPVCSKSAKLGRPLHCDAFRSHSDGNLFFEAGVRPLILGPGALESAHTPDEQTTLAEVAAAARIYTALALG